jgi:hypothetical protein
MFSKQQSIEFAKQYQWTAKDAERAFVTINLKQAEERDLLIAMVDFAGQELLNRQRSQASQKGLVTKKTDYIKKVEQSHAQKIKEYDENTKKERSIFVGIIANVYKFAKAFGMKDHDIEILLAQYEDEIGDESKDAA